MSTTASEPLTLTYDLNAPSEALFALPCSGSMTCECLRCKIEVAQRVKKGVARSRQPWEIAA